MAAPREMRAAIRRTKHISSDAFFCKAHRLRQFHMLEVRTGLLINKYIFLPSKELLVFSEMPCHFHFITTTKNLLPLRHSPNLHQQELRGHFPRVGVGGERGDRAGGRLQELRQRDGAAQDQVGQDGEEEHRRHGGRQEGPGEREFWITAFA